MQTNDPAAAEARRETWLWLAQRASAALLAGCLMVHLATIVVAVRGGLSAAEIVSRVGGHAGWLTFYLVFVVAVSVHGPIGLRAVLRETTTLSSTTLGTITLACGVALLLAGGRAVLILYMATP